MGKQAQHTDGATAGEQRMQVGVLMAMAKKRMMEQVVGTMGTVTHTLILLAMQPRKKRLLAVGAGKRRRPCWAVELRWT